MATDVLNGIEVGDQVYDHDGGDEFGAVRSVRPGGRNEIVVYVENAGDCVVDRTAIRAVHSGKVIVDVSRLPSAMQSAIRHAHDREEPGV